MDFVTKLEALKKNRPDVYSELMSEKVENSKTVKHGQKFEATPTAPVQISLKEAKKIIKANRPPRKPISDEQRARMIANLERGRETLRKRRESASLPIKANTAFQVKEKQQRQVLPAPSKDPDYEKFLELKRQQTALQSLQQKRNQSKYGAL